MQATQALPAHYRKIGTLDISKDPRLLLLLNLVGLVGLVISGWLFLKILFWLRPEDAARAFSFEMRSIAQMGLLIGLILVLTAFGIILHEAIHGIFFWWFTRSRPHFAFRGAYAYAAAPDWYIPRNPFLVTTLAPLLWMSLGGVILFLFVPAEWLLPIWFVLIMNASGAVGDVAVAGWLLRQPRSCLAQDRGDAVTLYVPGNE